MYKRKTRPAPWLDLAQRTPTEARSRRIRHVSKRRQKVTKEYRDAARAFVIAEGKAGKTCPVVGAIPELRNGKKYGWAISNRLTENHHSRGRLGSLLMDKRFWIALSKAGHRWIHANIAEARRHGWICEKGDWNKPVPL